MSFCVDRQYLCSKCGKTFVYESDMKKHQRYHVAGVRTPTHCPVCQKTFGTAYAMTVHMRVHTQEKPYQCDICQKFFRQFGNLQVVL